MRIMPILVHKFSAAKSLAQIPQNQSSENCRGLSNIYYNPTFSGKFEEKLKNIPDIHCACCGNDFVPKEEYKRLGLDEVTSTSVINIRELKKYEHKMKPTERQVFEILKNYSDKFPEENFQTLLQTANLKHLPKLEACQNDILNSVIEDLNKMSPDSKVIILGALGKISNILFNEPKEIPQKRYRSIQIFDNLYGPFLKRENELILFNKMCEKIISLPSSGQNVDAFIAKYTHRSPKEISQRLLKDTLPTIEHVLATANGGNNSIYNKIILCKDCNNERSNLPYKTFVKNQPEMKENLQIYIDKVIEQINQENLNGLEKYPLAIKKYFALNEIELNISKLKK